MTARAKQATGQFFVKYSVIYSIANIELYTTIFKKSLTRLSMLGPWEIWFWNKFYRFGGKSRTLLLKTL